MELTIIYVFFGLMVVSGLLGLIATLMRISKQKEKELLEKMYKNGDIGNIEIQMKIDKSKLTHIGSMNYILQIFSEKDSDEVIVDQYQPRRNKIWNGKMTKEELKPQVEETIERMKIAITYFEEYLEGKRDNVYYWQLQNEEYK